MPLKEHQNMGGKTRFTGNSRVSLLIMLMGVWAGLCFPLFSPSAAVAATSRELTSASSPSTTPVKSRPQSSEQQPSVLTYHNDNFRSGQNLNETILNTGNVNVNQFGKLFSYPTDGYIYGQPLYVPGVNIPGLGVHNVVYVATLHDGLYAFDADHFNSSRPLWYHSFINPDAGITTIPFDTPTSSKPELGIMSTPVIDLASNTIYVLVRTKEPDNYYARLHAIDLSSGQEKTGSPVAVTATLPGTGDGSQNGQTNFDAYQENQRVALLLANGNIYIAWAATFEPGTYHGWVISYNAQTLQQVVVYNDTANGSEGGIWQSGGGIAADNTGNLYLMTGNGTFNLNTGGVDSSHSLLKLSSGLQLLDYFTPFNQTCLNEGDKDLGGGSPLLLPDQAGNNPHLIVTAGKEGRAYLINRDNLGKFTPMPDNSDPCQSQNRTDIDKVVQETGPNTIGTGLYGTPSYWTGPDGSQYIFMDGQGDKLKAYKLDNGLLNFNPVSQSPESFPLFGATTSVSSNANVAGTGIVWAVSAPVCTGFGCGDNVPGILRAYDATNLANELYNSQQNATRDNLNPYVTFEIPTIVAGKVFVGTRTSLDVYGLLNSPSSLNVSPDTLVFSGTTAVNPSSQLVTLTVQPGTVNWSSTIFYSAGASNWLSLNTASGTVNPGQPISLTVNTFSTGLAAGTYTATVAFKDNANSQDTTQLTVTLNVKDATFHYFLPFLANAYKPDGTGTGSFTTYLAFQNLGNAAATVSLAYTDNQGNAITTPAGTCTSVAPSGECIAANPFASGSRGAGILTSNQPLAVIVSEGTPVGGSAYAVAEGANAILNVPFAFNKTFGNYSTQLTVFNGGTTAANVTVNFYDAEGHSPAGSSQTFPVGPKQSYSLDQSAATSNIPVGFNGWAQVVGPDGSQLVAQVLEQNPTNGYVAIANSQATPKGATGSTTTYAPAIFNNAYGSFVTGADILNPSSSAVTVSVTYYNANGTSFASSPFTIAPFGLTSIFQGASVVSGTVQPGLPANGLPAGFAGAAVVTSTGGGVIMAVNEFGGLTAGGTPQSGTYLAAANGGSKVGLPVIANKGFGYVTGDTIFNTSSQSVTASIQYYNLDGTTVGNATTFTVGPNSSQAFFQGATDSGLPNPFYGTAVVTVTNGPANALIVTTNAVSANFFYTFTEPNS